jgi:hypothetical protein
VEQVGLVISGHARGKPLFDEVKINERTTRGTASDDGYTINDEQDRHVGSESSGYF